MDPVAQMLHTMATPLTVALCRVQMARQERPDDSDLAAVERALLEVQAIMREGFR